jgi:uncharacterized protein
MGRYFRDARRPDARLAGFCEGKRPDARAFCGSRRFRVGPLAYFDWEKTEYRELPVDEQVEVLTMVGDISLKDGQPEVHAHVIVGRSDGPTRGGHLKEGRICPTLEVMLTESPADLHRTFDETDDLALIDPTALKGDLET